MPVAASAAVLGVWGVVAHDSGAGWVQALGALVAGALVVGMLGPGVAVARARCRVVASPRDASAGAAVTLEISTTVPLELQPTDPPGPVVMTRGGRAVLEVRPGHRGVLEGCRVTVASAAPFGILWWTRTVTLDLPRPLAVAPRVGRPQAGTRLVHGHDETPLAGPGRGADPRGVRPYMPGDRRTLVHWPATAHTGSLMVRETERPRQHVAVVDGRLPLDPVEAERQAERVLAVVHALLFAGAHVELETAEPEGEVVAPVTTLESAGRRLALASPRVGVHRPAGGSPGARGHGAGTDGRP